MAFHIVSEVIQKYNKIIAWGAGQYFSLYHHLLDGKISYIVDKNIELHNRKKAGIEIRLTDELLREKNKRNCLIVVFAAKFEEILEEAKDLGDFDIIDIKMLDILARGCNGMEKTGPGYEKEHPPVLVCAGIHALWQVNGARKCIDAQNKVLHERGIHTLELVPLKYYQRCNKSESFVAITIDKGGMEILPISDFVKDYPVVDGVIIHSLYYNHEILRELFRGLQIRRNTLYYIHDYYCICDYRFLYYKDEECFKNGSFRCEMCENRGRQEEIYHYHKDFFREYDVQLIAPSPYAAQIVEQKYGDCKLIVLPHLAYQTEIIQKVKTRVQRIAYLGSAEKIKGWEEYICIFKQLRPYYEFYCLGTCEEADFVDGISYVNVSLEEGHALNMIDALEKYDIDIVYLGSRVPETFSYTYYEAYEAGCFIITDEASGNICSQVMRNGNGIVFKNTCEAIKWLGDVERVSEDVRKVNERITEVHTDETFIHYLMEKNMDKKEYEV